MSTIFSAVGFLIILVSVAHCSSNDEGNDVAVLTRTQCTSNRAEIYSFANPAITRLNFAFDDSTCTNGMPLSTLDGITKCLYGARRFVPLCDTSHHVLTDSDTFVGRNGPGMIPRATWPHYPCYNNILNNDYDVSSDYLCGNWDEYINNNENSNLLLTKCLYDSGFTFYKENESGNDNDQYIGILTDNSECDYGLPNGNYCLATLTTQWIPGVDTDAIVLGPNDINGPGLLFNHNTGNFELTGVIAQYHVTYLCGNERNDFKNDIGYAYYDCIYDGYGSDGGFGSNTNVNENQYFVTFNPSNCMGFDIDDDSDDSDENESSSEEQDWNDFEFDENIDMTDCLVFLRSHDYDGYDYNWRALGFGEIIDDVEGPSVTFYVDGIDDGTEALSRRVYVHVEYLCPVKDDNDE